MDKIYEYNGKFYCETDYSLEIGDNWGGDLYDLYFDHSHDPITNGELCELTVYYSAYTPEVVYYTPEELVENFFEDYEVSFEQMMEDAEAERWMIIIM